MAMPSDIMMAVEFDWVTNARASDDYAGGSDNLLSMPHAALLMWSLGIRPSISRPAALPISVVVGLSLCIYIYIEATLTETQQYYAMSCRLLTISSGCLWVR